MEKEIRKAKDGEELSGPAWARIIPYTGPGDCEHIQQAVEHEPAKPEDAGEMAGELAEVMKQMAYDHERLARIESMLIFIMEKNALEMNRKPIEGEKVQGASSRVLYRRTWFEEWLEGWQKKLKEREKEEQHGNKKDNAKQN